MLKHLLNLQLFAEGGEASTGGTDSPSEVSVDSQTSPDAERAENYAKFKSDFKAEYDKDVQSIVKDRLKNANKQSTELKAKVDSYAPILEYLGGKYGVDPSDTEAILKAFNDDDAIYEQEAYEQGMTVEQLKSLKTLERENNKLKAEKEEQRKQAVFAEWDRQNEAMAQYYPGFDFATELNDPQFEKLVNNGVDIKTAYEVVHNDKLMAGAMSFASQKGAEAVTNAVIANKARPAENGLSNRAASIQRTDVSALSREQMADIKRRVMAGEHIDFKH